MTLPKNWKSLPAEKLVFPYQKPAFAVGDLETVKKIGDEMRKRLHAKGLIKTTFGWMSPAKVTRGLDENIITDRSNGKLKIAYRGKKVYNSKGSEIRTKMDFSFFDTWLKSYDEGKVARV